MKDVGLTELPVIAFASVAVHMRSTYYARSSGLHFINVPVIVQYVVRYLYNFVDDFMAAKMHFYSDDFHDHFSKRFGMENLPMHVRGQLPNKTSNFFPP